MPRNHWGGLKWGLSSLCGHTDHHEVPWMPWMFSLQQEKQQQDRGKLWFEILQPSNRSTQLRLWFSEPQEVRGGHWTAGEKVWHHPFNQGFVTTGCCWHLTLRQSVRVVSHISRTNYCLSCSRVGPALPLRRKYVDWNQADVIGTVCYSQPASKKGSEWKQSSLQVNYSGRNIQLIPMWITTSCCSCNTTVHL